MIYVINYATSEKFEEQVGKKYHCKNKKSVTLLLIDKLSDLGLDMLQANATIQLLLNNGQARRVDKEKNIELYIGLDMVQLF